MNEPTLEDSAGDDSLLLAETEVRHLKNTISALREEMSTGIVETSTVNGFGTFV